MISKEQFIKIIEILQDNMDFLEKSYELGIDLYSTKLNDSLSILEDTLFKIIFTNEAVNTIFWWIYEYDKKEPGMWDADNNVIPMKTVEDLWNYVKNYMKC